MSIWRVDRVIHRLLAALLLASLAPEGSAFQFDSTPPWPQPSTTFHVSIPASGADPNIWNDAFEGAMAEWNVTSFEYRIVRDSFRDPCSNPGIFVPANGVKFSATVCGDAWGETTLAITSSWQSSGVRTQSGIIFNSNESWNVYRGPWQKPGFSGIDDFRRVAVHELGHALGLGHEDGATAIMTTFAGDIEVPQPDDINGVNALYGKPPDLVVIEVSVSDATLTAGQALSIAASVKNQGVGTSPGTTLRYFRSTDSAISVEDTPLGAAAIATLSPGTTASQTLATLAPAAQGTFWVGACVDAVGGESATTNNCSSGVKITVSVPASDLIVTPVTVSDTRLEAGQTLTVTATVKNQGAGASAGTTLRYLRSTDESISAQDTEIGSDTVPGLASNAASSHVASTVAPRAAGIFWIGACVDPVSGESVTGNNCSIGVQIRVTVPDRDGDGVADVDDNCPGTSNADQADGDGDGRGDACDAFPSDPAESLDTDGDGIGDNADPDDDNDAVSDADEIAAGRNPLVDEAGLMRIIDSILISQDL